MKIDELTEVLEPRKETTELRPTHNLPLSPGVFTDISSDFWRRATRHAPPRITSAEVLNYIGEAVDEYEINRSYNHFMERIYTARNRGYITSINQSQNHERYSYEAFGYSRGNLIEFDLVLFNNIKIEISLRIDENR
jgi:hypothetical protein